MRFSPFLWFIYDLVEFPSVKLSKIFTVHWIRRDTNFKHEKSRVCADSFFFRFLQIYVFYRCRKTGRIDSAEKRALTKVKYLLPICQILRNFTVGNATKFTVSFAFCAHVDVIKYRKNTDVFLWERADYLSFRPMRTCDRKTRGSHLNNKNSSVKKHISKCHNEVHKGIEINTMYWKTTPQTYACSKHFTYESTHIPSVPERNAANSWTFCSNDCFIISREALCTIPPAY